MPIRLEIGTDIAMIGLWDPTRERHDLRSAKYAILLTELRSEAEDGRLFLINTGADGGYLTDIYIDEQPAPELLRLYDHSKREFLITTESGRFLAGGIEDLISSRKSITSGSDEFSTSPGAYALRHYDLNFDSFQEYAKQIVGNENYDYIHRKFGGFPLGCLFALIALGCLIARLWLVSVGIFTLTWGFLYIRNRILKRDKRFQNAHDQIGELESQFPPFIYVLRKVTDTAGLTGGCYDLP